MCHVAGVDGYPDIRVGSQSPNHEQQGEWISLHFYAKWDESNSQAVFVGTPLVVSPQMKKFKNDQARVLAARRIRRFDLLRLH